MLGASIVIAGILTMVMIHEGGHFVAAKIFGMKATEFFFGFGPKVFSVRRGETEYGMKALPLGGYVRIIGMNPIEEVAPEEEHRTYRGKPFWQKSIVVLAGISTHFVVAFALFYIVAVGLGERDFDNPEPVVRTVVEQLEDGTATPASLAGVQPDDRIVAVDRVPVVTWEDLTAYLEPRAGDVVTLTVDRAGERVGLRATLAERDTSDGVVGFLGVSPSYPRIRSGVVDGFGSAGGDVAFATKESFRGLWGLVVNMGDLVGAVFGGSDDVLGENGARPLSPIGIARLGAATEEVGIEATLFVVAWVFVFVGVVNMIPMYPLDGGHFAVALYTKVRGREPDVEKLVPVAAVVLIFLVLIGFLGLYFDLVEPISFM